MSNEQRRKYSPREAREQAAEAVGFLASIEIDVNGETFEIPQRGLLDDDQRERLNELELETESWDRGPSVDGLPGLLKVPYRVKGKLVKPAYPVRVAVALFGEDGYARFKAGGGRAGDVTAILAQLDRRVEEREKVDPKSAGGDSDMGAVADGD